MLDNQEIEILPVRRDGHDKRSDGTRTLRSSNDAGGLARSMPSY